MMAAEAVVLILGVLLAGFGLTWLALRRIEKCTRNLHNKGWDEW